MPLFCLFKVAGTLLMVPFLLGGFKFQVPLSLNHSLPQSRIILNFVLSTNPVSQGKSASIVFLFQFRNIYLYLVPRYLLPTYLLSLTKQ